MSASPLKRRAALATLDANAMTAATPTTNHGTSPTKAAAQLLTADLQKHAAANTPSPAAGTKRPPAADDEPCLPHHQQDSPAVKKSRREDDDQNHELQQQQQQQHAPPAPPSTQDSRSRTHSPDASSVFDTSAATEDASWSTAATEPEVQLQLQQHLHNTTTTANGSAASSRGVLPLTREQAREKVEILRLRLGLASYKLRTGQISIPLADLQAKPLPARFAAVAGTPASSPDEEEQTKEGKRVVEDDEEEVIAATPPLEEEQGSAAAPVAVLR